MKTKPLDIIIDTRESYNTKVVLKDLLGGTIKKLDVGDILVDEAVCIEHKTPGDFTASVYDYRLFKQMRNMVDAYPHNYIMISGSINDVMVRADASDRHNAMMGAIASCFRRGVPIIFCDSIYVMAEMIPYLAKNGGGK